MTERRRYVRFNANLSAIYKGVESSFAKAQSTITDLSREGVRLLLNKNMAQGTSVDLEMTIPGDNIPVVASGEICWSQKKGNDLNAGVKFTKIAPRDKAKLLEYLYKNWIESRL